MDSEDSGYNTDGSRRFGNDIDAERERWIELGNLGLEKSLLNYGVPRKKVSRIRTFLQQPRGEFEDLNAFLGVEDGVCIILATLGRASENNTNSSIPNLQYLDVGESFVDYNGVHFTKLIVGQRELDALWVNLLRNPKITKLTIQFDLEGSAYPFEHALGMLQTYTRDEIALTERRNKLLWVGKSDTEHTLIVDVRAIWALDGEIELTPEYGLLSIGRTTLDLVADVVTMSKIWYLDVSYGSLQHDIQDNSNESGKKLADALRKNTSLESFYIRNLPPSAKLRENFAGTLLTAFAEKNEGSHDHHYQHDNPNRTIIGLSLEFISSSALETLCSVLRTNKTLKAIGLQRSDFLPQEWAQKILDSLRGNDRLEVLDLSNSKGLTEDDVFDPLMNLLQFTSTALKSISLHGTGLDHKQSTINEELRVNQAYRTSLAFEDKITPTTGRIVLCGFPFAGKTSICKTLQKKDSRFKGWKTFLQQNPHLRQLLWGKGVHQELQNRTRGLDVTFRGKPPAITSIWDFGGQEEFYVLHDYLFPNAGNSCFLYVCSARRPPNDDGDREVKEGRAIRVEFRFWMRFIASNFKHLKDKYGRTIAPM